MDIAIHPSKQLECLQPRTWDDLRANLELKRSLHAFATSPGIGNNIAAVGINRSGKSTSVLLAVKAKLCKARDGSGNPCHRCTTCRAIGDGRWSHTGVFAVMDDCPYDLHRIDCKRPDPKEVEGAIADGMSGRPVILTLDDIDAKPFRPYQDAFQDVLALSNVTCLATAVAFKGRNGRRRVSAAVASRFSEILPTTVPPREDLVEWLGRLCDRFDIPREEAALYRVAERTYCIPGQAKRFLVHALRRGEAVTLALANRLDLDGN